MSSALLAVCALLLGACQGEESPTLDVQAQRVDPSPQSIPLDAPGEAAFAHMQDYLAVVRDPARFDECLTPEPLSQPHLCMVGARSGSRSGAEVHQWMEQQLAQIDGLHNVTRQEFPWPRFAPRHYQLSVDDGQGGRFEPASYPWHFQGVTGPGGVTGELVNLGGGTRRERLLAGSLEGKIVILAAFEHLNASEEDAQSELDAIAASGAVGAIYALPGPENDIVAQNYNAAEGLRGLPTLIVGKFDRGRLLALEGQSATLTLEGTVEPSSSSNVFGFIPGRDRSRLVVVGTPMNAWFQAASERGAGVGTLLYLARYFADQATRNGPPPVTLAFVATGAHETLGFGLERALRCLGPERVSAYVHLGSGLASRGYAEDNRTVRATGLPSARRWIVVSENAMLENLADAAFARVMTGQGVSRVRGGIFNHGEAQIPYAMKIPLLAMTGGGLFHHSPRDDETRLSVTYLDPVAQGFRDAIGALMDLDSAALSRANLAANVLADLTGRLPGYGCPSSVAVP
ncbi:MAG: hypothetical protein ABF296_06715 [Oceanococcaceae bacterium]